MRYLWQAFFARPDLPLLRVPWNALACVAAAVGGFFDAGIWIGAGAVELLYLITMASNPGFQQWIDNQRVKELHGDTDESRKHLLSKVGGAARQRYKRLEEKRARLETLYRDHMSDDLFADSNRNALRKLTWLFLHLLVGQRNLIVAPSSDERDLQEQIAALERELDAAPASDAVRGSKDATLHLLHERLDNVQHRATSLAEIEADLARIETQFDVALEEATLRGRPMAMSVNVDLTSRLLSLDDDSLEVSESQSLKEPPPTI